MDPGTGFALTPEEIKLQKRAREFSQTVARPRAAAVDASEEYPWDIAKALPMRVSWA